MWDSGPIREIWDLFYFFLGIAGVLRAVVEAANPGTSVLCLCEKGDSMIMEETGKIFKKEKEMKKGERFSFPG